jgi:hypothetical protein
VSAKPNLPHVFLKNAVSHFFLKQSHYQVAERIAERIADCRCLPGTGLCEWQLVGAPLDHDQVRLVAQLEAGEGMPGRSRYLDEDIAEARVLPQPLLVLPRSLLQAAELGVDALVADVDAATEVPFLGTSGRCHLA